MLALILPRATSHEPRATLGPGAFQNREGSFLSSRRLLLLGDGSEPSINFYQFFCFPHSPKNKVLISHYRKIIYKKNIIMLWKSWNHRIWMLSPLMLHYNCGGVAIVLLKKSRHLPLLLKNHHDISLINILSWYGLVYLINNRQIYYYIFINSISERINYQQSYGITKICPGHFIIMKITQGLESIRSKH